MAKGDKIPDAWDDDDWEAQADRVAKEEADEADRTSGTTPTPLRRAERLARHKQEQRKLWEAAEAPEEINFIAATNSVPLTTAFKPAVKLLSRKPAPRVIASKDPVTGLEKLTLQDEEDEEDQDSKKPLTAEEIRLRQQRELEEKQRRYDEARAKIFGDSNPSSGQSTPGSVTPPQASEGRPNYRGRGRGRGSGYRNDNRSGNNSRQDVQNSRPSSSQQQGSRELYDPNYSPKPGSSTQRRGDDSSPQPARSTSARPEDQAIRAPRGPDDSGRGGFGFGKRSTRDG